MANLRKAFSADRIVQSLTFTFVARLLMTKSISLPSSCVLPDPFPELSHSMMTPVSARLYGPADDVASSRSDCLTSHVGQYSGGANSPALSNSSGDSLDISGDAISDKVYPSVGNRDLS